MRNQRFLEAHLRHHIHPGLPSISILSHRSNDANLLTAKIINFAITRYTMPFFHKLFALYHGSYPFDCLSKRYIVLLLFHLIPLAWEGLGLGLVIGIVYIIK